MVLKFSQGNMYDWVTHMHTHIGGRCPHLCTYCYTQRNRFGVNPRYDGPIRLIEEEFGENYYKYRTGKTIFIEHMNDLFAKDVPEEWIYRILEHCSKFPENIYVFQSKNTERMADFDGLLPKESIVGTTIESDIEYPEISKAPSPASRLKYIKALKNRGFKTFITIEPIMKFSHRFPRFIIEADPTFINIGSDSKDSHLPEPSGDEVKEFIDCIMRNSSIFIKKKSNLGRLLI